MFLLQYLSQVTFFFGSFFIWPKSHPNFTKVYLESPIVLSSVLGLFHILYLDFSCILYLGRFQILYLGPSYIYIYILYIKHSAFIICLLTYFVIFFILLCFVFRAFLELCSCTSSYSHNAL